MGDNENDIELSIESGMNYYEFIQLILAHIFSDLNIQFYEFL